MNFVLFLQVWRVCLALPSARASYEAQLGGRDGILSERDFEITRECEEVLMHNFSTLAANDKLIAAMRSSLRFLDEQYGILRHKASYFTIVPVLVAFDGDYDQGKVQHSYYCFIFLFKILL